MAPKARQILDMNAFDPTEDTAPQDALLRRRQRNFGAASVLFYRHPIEMKRGRGCWMEAADGTRYLDFYNNVPSVGHCHPKVVEAVSHQIGELNINSRYLHPLTEHYLERLKDRLPDGIENVVMACSGSEANDLAMRIAMKASGGSGFIVTEGAYHGNTAAVTEISPASFKKRAGLPDHVRLVPAPSVENYGPDIASGFTLAVRQAVASLHEQGHAPAALVCDSIFSSDGVFADPPGFLQAAVGVMKDAGGLFIADEVQPGFARTGDAFWGFERHGLTPDIITTGKPMGNGFPMAGMASRPDLLAAFCEEVGYFNTFGGTPLAAAAGLAVLDAIEEDGLQENARLTGDYLRQRLDAIAEHDPRIASVRGAGLFIGVDLCDDGTPDPDLASDLINALRLRRVLIGAAGRFGHTLKLRPPLCLSREEADFFADALIDGLASV